MSAKGTEKSTDLFMHKNPILTVFMIWLIDQSFKTQL